MLITTESKPLVQNKVAVLRYWAGSSISGSTSWPFASQDLSGFESQRTGIDEVSLLRRSMKFFNAKNSPSKQALMAPTARICAAEKAVEHIFRSTAHFL